MRRAVERLSERGADGLLLFTPANILGFSGVPLGPSDRLVCALVNRAGDVVLVCPAFEAPNSRGMPPQTQAEVWAEDDDAFGAVAKAAERLGIAGGVVLLDPNVWISAIPLRLRRDLCPVEWLSSWKSTP